MAASMIHPYSIKESGREPTEDRRPPGNYPRPRQPSRAGWRLSTSLVEGCRHLRVGLHRVHARRANEPLGGSLRRFRRTGVGWHRSAAGLLWLNVHDRSCHTVSFPQNWQQA